jgi:hypothetical protein
MNILLLGHGSVYTHIPRYLPIHHYFYQKVQHDVTTLDFDPSVKPDIILDLRSNDWSIVNKLNFDMIIDTSGMVTQRLFQKKSYWNNIENLLIDNGVYYGLIYRSNPNTYPLTYNLSIFSDEELPNRAFAVRKIPSE